MSSNSRTLHSCRSSTCASPDPESVPRTLRAGREAGRTGQGGREGREGHPRRTSCFAAAREGHSSKATPSPSPGTPILPEGKRRGYPPPCRQTVRAQDRGHGAGRGPPLGRWGGGAGPPAGWRQRCGGWSGPFPTLRSARVGRVVPYREGGRGRRFRARPVGGPHSALGRGGAGGEPRGLLSSRVGRWRAGLLGLPSGGWLGPGRRGWRAGVLRGTVCRRGEAMVPWTRPRIYGGRGAALRGAMRTRWRGDATPAGLTPRQIRSARQAPAIGPRSAVLRGCARGFLPCRLGRAFRSCASCPLRRAGRQSSWTRTDKVSPASNGAPEESMSDTFDYIARKQIKCMVHIRARAYVYANKPNQSILR